MVLSARWKWCQARWNAIIFPLFLVSGCHLGIISQEISSLMDVPQFYPTNPSHQKEGNNKLQEMIEINSMISNLKKETTVHFPAPSHTVDASEIPLVGGEYPTLYVPGLWYIPWVLWPDFWTIKSITDRLHQPGSWGRSFRVWRAISGGYATKGLWSIGWGLAFGHSLLCILVGESMRGLKITGCDEHLIEIENW